jgi:hypothetical protein
MEAGGGFLAWGCTRGLGYWLSEGFLWVWFVEGHYAGMGSIPQSFEIHNGQGGIE